MIINFRSNNSKTLLIYYFRWCTDLKLLKKLRSWISHGDVSFRPHRMEKKDAKGRASYRYLSKIFHGHSETCLDSFTNGRRWQRQRRWSPFAYFRIPPTILCSTCARHASVGSFVTQILQGTVKDSLEGFYHSRPNYAYWNSYSRLQGILIIFPCARLFRWRGNETLPTILNFMWCVSYTKYVFISMHNRIYNGK